jgi:DNA-binding response OmpR family regulator
MTPPILLIDDDAMVRMAISRVLEMAGFGVAVAEDGFKGLKLLHAIEPKLVITDIVMPEKEGIETIIEMRAIRPDLKIIAISGGARLGSITPVNFLEVARSLGADDVIAKPFEPEELIAKVRKQLGEA